MSLDVIYRGYIVVRSSIVSPTEAKYHLLLIDIICRR